MARPVDHERRARLLEAAGDYVIENGLSDLSLRPLARELGVTTTTLVHHFGSRDQLLTAIIGQVRDRMRQAVDLQGATDIHPHALMSRAWRWMSDPGHAPLYRLLFEIYGNALQQPQKFQPFLAHIVEDWLRILTETFEAAGDDHDTAATKATLAIAVARGLLLDLLTTGDTDRITTAFETFMTAFSRCDHGVATGLPQQG
ncbi:TetR/AcrR family transcriptional regulator [Nocardia noduli]|uniref:TetR/AcrR family transcriptional regulator n=1 Tax=Nocardia noduli TaxID=2815722 RepID=UPI001C24D6BF|nr:TetR/AcrR family transcriptional regulator [Nocardia noduli]